MTSVEEILGLDRPLFSDNDVDLTELPPLPIHEMDRARDELKAARTECQFQKVTVSKLENELKDMKKLLEECQQVKFNAMEKKEYSQTYLSHLNKSILTKKGELLQLKNQNHSSAKDEDNVAQRKMSKIVLEQLFDVKFCTKYSNKEAVRLKLNKKCEGKGPDVDKENYFQIPNNSEKAWALLESWNQSNIYEKKSVQDNKKSVQENNKSVQENKKSVQENKKSVPENCTK
uniref:Uncharacterized protein n=1 Tax=Cacopsylla melanoneura TaxID=428564 RepID=A0A8D8MAI7_9HEMI